MNAAVLWLALAASAGAPEVLTLDGALSQARERNLDLKVAQARLDQVKEISSKVWAGYLPQINAGGAYTHNNVEAKIALPTGYWIREVGKPQGPVFDPTKPPGLGNPPGGQTTHILFPSGLAEAVIQPLDQWAGQVQLSQGLVIPALWPAIRNASLAVNLASLNVEAARREILFAVAQLYYGAAGLKQAVSIQEKLLAMNVDHEKDARVRYEAGAVPKVSLLRAEIDRARSEQDLKRAQISLQGMRLMLATLLDRPADFDVVTPPEPKLPGDVKGILDSALDARPDIKAARAAEDLANRQHSAVWYKFAPNLALTGTYRIANFKGFTGEYDAWAVGAGLSWTIYDGGLRESELRETQAKIVEAEQARRSAEAKAQEEGARAVLDLESARANREKAKEQLSLARESAQLVNVSFSAGAATYLEVADASAALAASELGYLAESLNADLAALKLLKAAGVFDPH